MPGNGPLSCPACLGGLRRIAKVEAGSHERTYYFCLRCRRRWKQGEYGLKPMQPYVDDPIR